MIGYSVCLLIQLPITPQTQWSSTNSNVVTIHNAFTVTDGNPQYRLEVRAQHNATVWILLSRHITEKASICTLIYSLICDNHTERFCPQ